MLKRLELAGRAMINKMAQMETITNNLANLNTVGFKRDEMFTHSLNKKIKAIQKNRNLINPQEPFPATISDFAQGNLADTKRTLDVAITGEGMFVIETPEGEVFTRDGRFTLNEENLLTTIDGYAVMGEGGPIELDMQQNSASQLLINEKGEILLDGNLIDKFKIVTFENPQNLMKLGSNLYQLFDKNIQSFEAENFALKQGYLEDSNVNPIIEMVNMLEINHAFKASEKAIKTHDQLLDKAANHIGRF